MGVVINTVYCIFEKRKKNQVRTITEEKVIEIPKVLCGKCLKYGLAVSGDKQSISITFILDTVYIICNIRKDSPIPTII